MMVAPTVFGRDIRRDRQRVRRLLGIVALGLSLATQGQCVTFQACRDQFTQFLCLQLERAKAFGRLSNCKITEIATLIAKSREYFLLTSKVQRSKSTARRLSAALLERSRDRA